MNALQVRCILAMSADGITDAFLDIVLASYDDNEWAILTITANAAMVE